jgi:predicted metal-dependent peptidase
VRNKELEHLQVEEIYELVDDEMLGELGIVDLLDAAELQGELGDQARAQITQMWEEAVREAQAAELAGRGAGTQPAGIERLLRGLRDGALDWRTILWSRLVTTPTDFGGYDRRFLGRGLYLDAVVEEPVDLLIAVDTSGSITAELLSMFLSEVIGIVRVYPHMRVQLFYCDAAVHGPVLVRGNDVPPLMPVGGGGTAFEPFFERIEAWGRSDVPCVYLTDGHGTFPADGPVRPTIWVVPAGGRPSDAFPFGTVVRMLGEQPE